MVTVVDLDQRRREFVEQRLKTVQATIAKGQTAYLLESLGLGADSMLNGEKVAGGLDIDTLRQFGYWGWEVISVVPWTMGTGHIGGIHVLLRFAITGANFTASREVVEKYFTVEAARLVK